MDEADGQSEDARRAELEGSDPPVRITRGVFGQAENLTSLSPTDLYRQMCLWRSMTGWPADAAPTRHPDGLIMAPPHGSQFYKDQQGFLNTWQIERRRLIRLTAFTAEAIVAWFTEWAAWCQTRGVLPPFGELITSIEPVIPQISADASYGDVTKDGRSSDVFRFLREHARSKNSAAEASFHVRPYVAPVSEMDVSASIRQLFKGARSLSYFLPTVVLERTSHARALAALNAFPPSVRGVVKESLDKAHGASWSLGHVESAVVALMSDQWFDRSLGSVNFLRTWTSLNISQPASAPAAASAALALAPSPDPCVLFASSFENEEGAEQSADEHEQASELEADAFGDEPPILDGGDDSADAQVLFAGSGGDRRGSPRPLGSPHMPQRGVASPPRLWRGASLTSPPRSGAPGSSSLPASSFPPRPASSGAPAAREGLRPAASVPRGPCNICSFEGHWARDCPAAKDPAVRSALQAAVLKLRS